MKPNYNRPKKKSPRFLLFDLHLLPGHLTQPPEEFPAAATPSFLSPDPLRVRVCWYGSLFRSSTPLSCPMDLDLLMNHLVGCSYLAPPAASPRNLQRRQEKIPCVQISRFGSRG
jgi:hypothetical protein